MTEVNFAGVYLPPLLLYLIAALPVFVGTRALLTRTGVLRFVWHPGQMECAVYLAILAALFFLL